jgi:hypothetical protein
MKATMTLAQIRAMFQVGQVWEAVNTLNPKADGARTLQELHTKQFVWSSDAMPRFWMNFPKAGEIVEASDGKLVFRILGNNREGTITLRRRAVCAA